MMIQLPALIFGFFVEKEKKVHIPSPGTFLAIPRSLQGGILVIEALSSVFALSLFSCTHAF